LGPRDGKKRVRECVYGAELDLATIAMSEVWVAARRGDVRAAVDGIGREVLLIDCSKANLIMRAFNFCE
jgi:hypothetical protein